MSNNTVLPTLNNESSTQPLYKVADILDNQRVPVNSNERNKKQGEIPYYGATGQVGWIDDYLFDEELVLLGEDGAPFLDKSKPIAYLINGKSWVNNHAHVLKAKKGITTNKYLKYYLDSIDYNEYVSGTTRLKLTQGVMRQIPVKILPLAEQEKLANILDEQTKLIITSKEQIEKVKKLVVKFRQAILSAAVSGKLTEEWRVSNTNTTPITEVIKKNIFKQSDIEGWNKTKVGELYSSFGGGTPSRGNPDYWNGNIPWVSSGDVKLDFILHGSETITKAGLDSSSANLCKIGSVIVVVRSGILKHTLPVAVIKNELAINQDIKCFDCNNEDLNYWLFLFLKGYEKYILALNREGTTVQSVKYDTLKDLEIDIPSIEEQVEIKKRITQYMEIANTVEKQIEKAEKKVKKLNQSILVKAFQNDAGTDN